MDNLSLIIFAALFLTIGYHLGWKRGNRAGLNITVHPPVINIIDKDDDDQSDWWKNNDRPKTDL
jgi:hypothetical protein